LEAEAYEHAIGVLRTFLDDQPESAIAWQALAWSYYCVHRYDEALSCIARALKLKEDMQAVSIRACILAEKGIKEGSKPLVLEAKRSFEQLASIEIPSWQSFYNLGNVLSALGKHRDAITRYRQALKLNAREPMIWKNLGSAYHLVGDHQAEMDCFDSALELDPLKPEALVSKGVSLLVDFGKPKEAALLLECALRSKPDFAVQWPHIWYWLGASYQRSGSLSHALFWVEDGLARQPDNPALKRLLSQLLSEFGTQDPDVAQKARRLWEDQLAEEPLDYEARSRLADLEIREGNESTAWGLLEACFGLTGVHSGVPLRTSRFSVDECIPALMFLPQYAAFRKRFPVSDYWNREDPLYDLGFSPPVSDHIQEALTTFLGIPFGLGLSQLEEASVVRGSKESLTSFIDVLRAKIEHAVVEASRELATLIPSRDQGAEATANKSSEITLFLGLIALRECGRQRGWITTQFRISPETLNLVLESYDEALIEVNVVAKSLARINEEIGFLNPRPPGDGGGVS